MKSSDLSERVSVYVCVSERGKASACVCARARVCSCVHISGRLFSCQGENEYWNDYHLINDPA